MLLFNDIASFCHPENFLLSILWDNREQIRSSAIGKLICVRNQNTGTPEIRIFEVLVMLFKAKKYFDVINWQLDGCFQPPLSMNDPCK